MAAHLEGRRVVLGVCGGIAAYKAIELCRRLVDAGAHVAPVLTADATRFVGTVTFSALASEAAQTSLWDGPDPIPHTRLGQGADVIVVAPATARVIGTYAHGISDDLLTATLLATRAPVVVCPAMHTEMWEHAAVQDNITLLRERGVEIVDPEVGRLAGGDEGAGRLADLDTIVAAVERVLAPHDFEGLTVLVTAGGTREPIDPVRFIGNRSSGKQGLAIAEEASARGARVVLVTTVLPERALANTEFMFPFVSVVKCPQEKMLEKMGGTLVGTAITNDAQFQRTLLDWTHIDRLNIGPLKTIALNWLQPHEGSIVDFLFRARAFQFDKGMLKV